MAGGRGKHIIDEIRGWEDEADMDYTLEELLAKNDTSTNFSHDMSTSGGVVMKV